MLRQHRNNDRTELTALRLVNRNRIGQIQLHDIFLTIVYLPVVRIERHHTSQVLVIYRDDSTDVSVKYIQLIIVSSMNNSISLTKDPLPYF